MVPGDSNFWDIVIAGLLSLQTGLQLFWIKTLMAHEKRITRNETICGATHMRRQGDFER